ncbi:hypothetical protein K9M47_02565 [Candidatus Gracilibacteria bacterium]|nr:hypothetical protein [Candidatus Gracilibacteria bacterium]MCF7898769.1 hypothetical protein [Candidatus Paceibacterota bacterium]
MLSDVTRYEVLISEALRAVSSVANKEKSLKRAKALLEKITKPLLEVCKKCLDRVVADFNSHGGYYYQVAVVGISINFQDETISVGFELRSLTCELDETFDKDDYDTLFSSLKPHVDEELKKIGTPFKFSSFSVPNSYYSK